MEAWLAEWRWVLLCAVRRHLKPNNVTQFTETMEKDVISLLRRQLGFRDEVRFLPADGSSEAVAISIWEKHENENAEAYQRGVYPGVVKAVARVADGTLHV